MSVQEAVNRRGWAAPQTLAVFDNYEGFVDEGERAALLRVAPHVRGEPILDLGVGGGRTTSLLLLLSGNYLGLDYTPEMVALCQRKHPGVDIRHGDARDLSMLSSLQFGFILFSFNGIDAVDRDGRALILRELQRLVLPGGYIVFSTLNQDGPSWRRRPWQLGQLVGPGNHPLARALLSLPVRAGRYWSGFRNWLRLRRMTELHGGWSLAPLHAHEFSLLVHYTTLVQAINDVTDLGLEVVDVFGDTGAALTTSSDTSGIDSFQLVLRRP